jgi:hypothetical protein
MLTCWNNRSITRSYDRSIILSCKTLSFSILYTF